jgi:hypothetical protein
MVVWKLVRFSRVEGESGGAADMKTFNMDMNVESMKKEKNDVRAEFTFRMDYSKKVGYLVLKGWVIVGGSKKELEDLLAAWRRRKLPEEFAAQLGNVILYNCQVNGVLLSRVLALPAPVIPPNLTPAEVSN